MDFIFRKADLQTDVSGRTIFGIAAPFDQWAEVHDNKGPSRPYQERIARGAFARSIRERGHKISLIYDHQHESTLPIGRAVRLEERDDGLYGEFQVARTARGDEALELVRDGMLDGFSIRAGIVKSKADSRSQVTRHELALADVSLTPQPVYGSAGVQGIRSYTGSTPLSVDLASRLLAVRLKVSNL